MATGIVATLSGAGTITYSPLTDAKCILNGMSSGNFTVNGIAVAFATNSNSYTYFVGAGQTLTIVGVSGSNLILSALES